MMKDRKVLLHCHLFKNAGTTLDWALARSFKKGFYDHRDDHKIHQDGINYVNHFLGARPTIIALSSHHMPFMPEHNDHYWWLILLREPLRRVRSVYDFEVKQRPISSLGSKMAKKLNFSEYIKWRMQADVPAVIKNYYCRYLNNMSNPAAHIDESFLERAYNRLSLKNVLVGTVEKFDESMVYFEESLNKDFPGIDLSYVRQNVGSEVVGNPVDFLDELATDTRDILIEKNQWDKKLYDMVKAKQQQVFDEIPEFEGKLNDLKKRCTSLAV